MRFVRLRLFFHRAANRQARRQAQSPGGHTAPSERMRGLAVPITTALALGSAYAVGVHWVEGASNPALLAMEAAQPLAALQAGWAGASIHVPSGPGFWFLPHTGGDGVLVRAHADGNPQRVGLCGAQRNPQPGAPDRLYPMALVAGLPGAQGLTAHNPIVLAPELASGLPQLWLEGDAAADGSRIDLALRVPAADDSAALRSPRTWVLAMVSRAGEGGAGRYHFDGEAWLLWRDRPAAADQAFQHAVRIRRLPDAGCAAGAIEWQLFRAGPDDTPAALAANPLPESTAASAAAGRSGLKDGDNATLWARSSATADADGRNARPTTWRVSLPPGVYTVPGQPQPPLEDRALFTQALKQGLIRILPDQRLALLPADVSRLAPASAPAGLPPLEEADRPLLKSLHTTANGQYVRQQIVQANQARHWLALRVSAEVEDLPIAAEPAAWQASTGQERLATQEGLPPVWARLVNTLPDDGGRWVRVLAPQRWLEPRPGAAGGAGEGDLDSAPVTVTLPYLAARAPEPVFRVLVLGQVLNVQGARLLSQRPACDGPACRGADMLTELRLAPQALTQAVTLTLRPESRFNALNPAASEQQRVQWKGKQATWVDAPEGSAPRQPAAEVRVLAADGQTLYTEGKPTRLAQDLGVVPVVGLGPSHGHALSGMLGRLGELGHGQVQARTTLEPAYQQVLSRVLGCIGIQGQRWDAAAGVCEGDDASAGTEARPPAFRRDERRIAHAVVMDAHTGDILAVANGRPLPWRTDVAELLSYDAFNAPGSALRVGAWGHSGGLTQAPGSTFKVVDALMLEAQALKQPVLAHALQGMTPTELEALARQRGLAFAAAGACYPAPCDGPQAKLRNFGDAPATRHLSGDGKLGLQQAIGHSINTWFGMLGEWTDATVAKRQADARPLGSNALRAERPLLATLDALGFHQATALDGGLLPAGLRWRAGDVLQADASALDPLEDAHNVRQQALGLRMQTTPLQMARVAAAVATGAVPTPRLLAQLDERQAAAPTPRPLGVPMLRLQQAMNAVVTSGTARSAFQATELPDVRRHAAQVFGKTGSAPMASRDAEINCKALPAGAAAPLACLHNAWFIGYLAPGALPGEARTLAFAVQITHTPETGGRQAAPVVAQWMQTLWARSGAKR